MPFLGKISIYHSQNTDPKPRRQQKFFLDFCIYIVLMNRTVQENNETTWFLLKKHFQIVSSCYLYQFIGLLMISLHTYPKYFDHIHFYSHIFFHPSSLADLPLIKFDTILLTSLDLSNLESTFWEKTSVSLSLAYSLNVIISGSIHTE